MRRFLLTACLLGLLGCPEQDDDDVTDDDDTIGENLDDDDDDDSAAVCETPFPIRHTADPEAVERGRALLEEGTLGDLLMPAEAIEYLWLTWGTGPLDEAGIQDGLVERYGFAPAPAGLNGGWPLGLHETAGGFTIGCLACHADLVAGETVIGAGSGRIDLEALYDDLVELRAIAATQGIIVPEPPWDLDGLNTAAGAQDAFGLGMRLSEGFGPDLPINTEYGPQQPAAWWTMQYKDRVYADGSGQAGGHRTMAAMLLAFGIGPGSIEARDQDMQDVRAYILSTEAPAWPFESPDEDVLARGAARYEEQCAGCHGLLCETLAPGEYPDRISNNPGTDRMRADGFGATEEAWVNGSWYGAEHPVEATGGYLAPPLMGVWATAPYFHNGSVPTLEGVLFPQTRPTRWQRTGSGLDDYDPQAVGLRFTTPSQGGSIDTAEGRRVIDTDRPGLSNVGHNYGTDLPGDDRRALIAWLTSL